MERTVLSLVVCLLLLAPARAGELPTLFQALSSDGDGTGPFSFGTFDPRSNASTVTYTFAAGQFSSSGEYPDFTYDARRHLLVY